MIVLKERVLHYADYNMVIEYNKKIHGLAQFIKNLTLKDKT